MGKKGNKQHKIDMSNANPTHRLSNASIVHLLGWGVARRVTRMLGFPFNFLLRPMPKSTKKGNAFRLASYVFHYYHHLNIVSLSVNRMNNGYSVFVKPSNFHKRQFETF